MAKHYLLNGITLTDLHNMEVAIRLRYEACEENLGLSKTMDVELKKDIANWLKTHNKILKAIDRIQGTIPPSDPLRKMPR